MVSEAEKIKKDVIDSRLSYLESIAHTPTDWEIKIKSLEDNISRLYKIIDLIENKKED